MNLDVVSKFEQVRLGGRFVAIAVELAVDDEILEIVAQDINSGLDHVHHMVLVPARVRLQIQKNDDTISHWVIVVVVAAAAAAAATATTSTSTT